MIGKNKNTNPIHIYLDINVFDDIEKISKLTSNKRKVYTRIHKSISDGSIVVPYSNAHLNDLYRGYKKTSKYIEGHLNNISTLTNNLCICQYWNQENATWHYRDIFEFFEEKKADKENSPSSFEEYFSEYGILTIFKLLIDIPLPQNWNEAYKHGPLFDLMFPESKSNGNVYSMIKDIFDFQLRLQDDYSLYKTYRKHLLESINLLKKKKEFSELAMQLNNSSPKHLDLFKITETYQVENDSIKNKQYSKVIDDFFKLDLKGYKADSAFNNMFDDALHTFYAAHCDYFITSDEKCIYKAEKTYSKLNINTKVMRPIELYETLKPNKKISNFLSTIFRTSN